MSPFSTVLLFSVSNLRAATGDYVGQAFESSNPRCPLKRRDPAQRVQSEQRNCTSTKAHPRQGAYIHFDSAVVNADPELGFHRIAGDKRIEAR